MRAAFYNGKGQVRLDEVAPAGPDAGEVVVQVSTCGVCGSDVHSFLTHWPQQPYTPGHEIAGVVAAVGEGVAGLAVGDAVAVEPFVPCGECRFCLSGQYSVCPHHVFLSWSRPGGFADQLAAPARCLFPLPEGPARQYGALVEPLAVAVHALRRAPLKGSDIVLVLGAGSIGLLAAAAAQALGAGRVILTAKHPHQADAAGRLGLAHVLRVGEGNPEEAILELTGGEGADVVVDSVGGSQGIDLAVKAVRRGGTVSLVGAYVMPARTNLQSVISREVRLVGSNCYGIADGRRDFALAIGLLTAGKVQGAPLVTHTFPLAEVQRAFETATDKATGAIKVWVEPGEVISDK